MSFASALHSAQSGLLATGRGTQLLSDNIANALTEGFARRSLVLASEAVNGGGAGVRVAGVLRAADPAATAARRRGEGAEAEAGTLAEGRARLYAVHGRPGDPGSLASLAGSFGTALLRLGASPDSAALQAALLGAAAGLAQGLAAASREVQQVRMDADRAIARDVAALNDRLAEIAALNGEIRARAGGGGDTAALEDRRQLAIDAVNRIVPVRIARRDGGAVALYTGGGAVLLDGQAGRLGFTPTPTITADMTLGSGALATVSLNGRAVAFGAGGGPLDGGTLGAAFALRDDAGPAAQAGLDAIAADLLQRVEAVDTDAGGAGLFTDGGAPYAAALETGLAGRIAVNAAVDPAQGGALWRLRDGLQAAAPGPAGDAALLAALADAWAAARPAAPGSGTAGSFGAEGLMGAVAALAGEAAGAAETAAATAAGAAQGLREAELARTGVDTDAEMQRLLVLERAYAANARVIAAVDEMLGTLLEMR
jgi:flagellar hook-associated protein 1 FlgK